MVSYNINSAQSSLIVNNEELVFGGKNGFITPIGVIPVVCNSYTANINSVVFSVPNLYQLFDDNYNTNILDVIALQDITDYSIKLSIDQYVESTGLEGSVGYVPTTADISLDLESYDLNANTITVTNKTYGDSVVSDIFLTAPFYLSLYQLFPTNNFPNPTAYIGGSNKTITRTSNVSGVSGTYVASIGVVPASRNDVSVYLDDISNDSFTLDGNEITIFLDGNSTELKSVTRLYTVPGIEKNDFVSLSVFNNTYSVSNTSYTIGEEFYDEALTANNLYKVKLNKPISASTSGLSLVNISPDLVGTASNITSNSFTVTGPTDYPYTYKLANTGIYYLYQKNKVQFTTARVDEFGRLVGVSPDTYVVEATNVNRYNRTSSSVKTLLDVAPLTISKVSSIDIEEKIITGSSGGATINITVTFPVVKGRDITGYDLNYRVESTEETVVPGGTVFIPHDETQDSLSYTITNVSRGRSSGSNNLIISVTPLLNLYKGFPTRIIHPIIGKQAFPSGLINLNAVQQGDFILFSWQFQQTAEGFLLDLDTKEVEIRVYPGYLDTSSQETILASWSLALPIARVSFPNSSYAYPIGSFGSFTYLLRTRDTSEIESLEVAAAALVVTRPPTNRVFKTYNESNPGVSYADQDGAAFPTSNVHPELPFTSYSEVINGGLVLYDSSNTDNANGSAIGFSVYGNTNALSTGTNSIGTYITPIRDMGRVIRGTIRLTQILGVNNPGIAYNTFYNTTISGITDYHLSTNLPVSSNVLVDNAFGGLGTILGYNNSNAAAVTYNTYHKTLTSGGVFGNVYAIRNPGQFTGDYANNNSYALIAGVINENAVALGEVFYANGEPSGSNNFGNVAISGNSFELINFLQYGDPEGYTTFLGPDKSIVQNVFIRLGTDNVFYDAASNGVIGYPGHGNVNQNAFVSATNNADLGWKNYIPGLSDFRYFQVKLEIINPTASVSEILLEDLKYEINVPEKTVRHRLTITDTGGYLLDYSYAEFYAIPEVSITVVDTASSVSVVADNVTLTDCTIKAYDTQNGNPVSDVTVSIVIIGG
jgi:hypothetical protein